MDEMKNLVDKLNDYAYRYYVLDTPIISDAEYDKLYDKLVELEKSTGIVLPNSPTQRVGDTVLSNFKKVTHKMRLYSLDKCQSKQSLLAWLNDTLEKEKNVDFTLEYKFDGLTIVCTYKDGYLKSCATRGNGIVGEDVTLQVKTIKSVPLSIDFKGELIVQGEGMITLSNLKKFNQKYPNDALKNARNAVSGAIRNLDPKETAKRNLDWFCYNVLYAEGKSFSTQIEMFDFLNKNGFLISPYKHFKNPNDILKEIDKVDKEKSNLDILIDGMVVKINQLNLRDEFGYTSKFPKWAMAYKFEAQELSTILKDVIWQVGRTGKITPIAIIDPVNLSGATIYRATLNNYMDILRKNISIGSRVFVRRSNEVIPEIMGLAEQLEGSKPIIKPKVCPSCKTPLVQIGALDFCPNSDSCPEQIIDRITHFATRNAMDIEGFRDSTAKLLYDTKLVKDVADLYSLKEDDLLKLPLFKEKKARNLLDAIEKSKDVELSNFIYSLSILNVGIKTAKDLAKYFRTLDDLKNATEEDLAKIRDIGDVVAHSICEYFSNEKNLSLIDRLLKAGVKIKNSSQAGNNSGIFEGKTFVLTGTLESYTRAEATALIEKNGGQTSSSVSKNTDYVLAGKEAGSKLSKAQSLGIKVIDEQTFKNLLKL